MHTPKTALAHALSADNKNTHRKFSHIQSFKSHPCTRKNDTFPHFFVPLHEQIMWYDKDVTQFFFPSKKLFHEFFHCDFHSRCCCVRKITLAIFQCNASSGAVCIFLYKSDMNIPRTLCDLYLHIYLLVNWVKVGGNFNETFPLGKEGKPLWKKWKISGNLFDIFQWFECIWEKDEGLWS